MLPRMWCGPPVCCLSACPSLICPPSSLIGRPVDGGVGGWLKLCQAVIQPASQPVNRGSHLQNIDMYIGTWFGFLLITQGKFMLNTWLIYREILREESKYHTNSKIIHKLTLKTDHFKKLMNDFSNLGPVLSVFRSTCRHCKSCKLVYE